MRVPSRVESQPHLASSEGSTWGRGRGRGRGGEGGGEGLSLPVASSTGKQPRAAERRTRRVRRLDDLRDVCCGVARLSDGQPDGLVEGVARERLEGGAEG